MVRFIRKNLRNYIIIIIVKILKDKVINKKSFNIILKYIKKIEYLKYGYGYFFLVK